MNQLTTGEWFRRAIGVEYSEESPAIERVGELELAGFQARAASRGLDMARRFGGVLIADAVGLGKTRVALTVAAALARDERKVSGVGADILCLVPARLRPQWKSAAAKAGLTGFEVRSHTELSRNGFDGKVPSIVLVDEAHRFRNPGARRSRALARLASDAFVVMLSATPVCNSVWDLYHLLSVFCAEEDFRELVGYDLRGAFEAADRGAFDITELLRFVVIRRRSPGDSSAFAGRPSVSLEMLEYQAGEDEAWLWQNLESELDGLMLSLLQDNWPRGLFQEHMLKRWESGSRALSESLERLVEYHRRWFQAHRHGRSLSRSAFNDLFDRQGQLRQEVFPFLFDADETHEPVEARIVREDLEIFERLHQRSRCLVRRGDGRVRAVVELARSLDGKLLVFSSYQSSAREIYRALEAELGPRARLALVTGGRAQATGLGRVRADDVIRRFAPMAHGLSDMAHHQQIEVLVATDCLSEGVNLQDCSHIVLADLPYSPLAVEQRIGRLVRPGAASEVVRVYLPRPGNWKDSLGLRRRLRGKLHAASRSGSGFVASEQLMIDAPNSPADQSVEDPLAAMTRLDRLARIVEAPRAGPLPADDRVALCGRFEPALWVRYVVRAEGFEQFGWLRVTDAEGPVARLGRNLPWLIAGAESEWETEHGEPAPELEALGERFLRRRRRRMRSARAAPRQIAADSPQRQLWLRLCQASRTGELQVTATELERLRDVILRSHTRGRRRYLRRVLDCSPSVSDVLSAARALGGRQKSRSGDIDIDILGRLYLPGD